MPGSQRAPWWLIALLVVLSPLLLALLLVAAVAQLLATVSLHLAVWLCWLPRRRNILFVYSDSPVWREYIDAQILPKIAHRSIVLNWSQRNTWRPSLARVVFRHFGGSEEFNPMAVVFPLLRPAQVFRFWQPFRDWKHGRREPLERLQAMFFAFIGIQ